jgi:hypothetical protein
MCCLIGGRALASRPERTLGERDLLVDSHVRDVEFEALELPSSTSASCARCFRDQPRDIRAFQICSLWR